MATVLDNESGKNFLEKVNRKRKYYRKNKEKNARGV